jgi:N-acetyl-anhydromuramyl-L-alanine amidase AmpD
MALDLNTIKQIDFPEDHFFKTSQAKKQIVIHHTAGNDNISGIVEGWKERTDKVCVSFIIAADGTINQLFSSDFWAYHLGLRTDFLKAQGFSDSGIRNDFLNKLTIGIEITNWGPVTKVGDKYYNYVGGEMNPGEVVEYENPFKQVPASPFNDANRTSNKPCTFYHSYTAEQIVSLKDLLLHLCEKFNIPKDYHDEMWDVSFSALRGDAGIWTHVSYRTDKSDCHPQSELIDMLTGLSGN